MVRRVTAHNYEAFINEKPVAAIHIDGEWDVGCRDDMRRKMAEVERALGSVANIGEIDCDKDPDLAKLMGVLNVPAVAYFRDGSLVAALVGADQDVNARIERVLHNEPIGDKDGTKPV